MTSQDTRPLPFVYQFISGAVAGISEILLMYPLDVVKTRLQLQGLSSSPAKAGAATTTTHYTGIIDCVTKIVKLEGPSHLYRGISAPIIMEAPKRATKFAANDEYSKLIPKLLGYPQMNQPLAILTGACAGATESFVVVPFELVKIRLQAPGGPRYSGPLDVVKSIVVNEGGIKSLYTGLEATLWRHVMWNAAYFGSIHQIRSLMPKYEGTKKTIADLISGSIGGCVGTILNIPFDVVKTRIQNQVKTEGVKPKYVWTLPGLAIVYREEGPRALFKGLLPKVLRLGPGGGVLLVVFTKTMDFFRGWHYGNDEVKTREEKPFK
ncbi:mitochondrial 2-oxodicarboxylate carrier [Saccharomycopsis crataegensis]|uniref:Mitochondrial 2-oxodicarboxylate carrier n=1 Tax=Saccharomycopsis crataegensis TaxID=43959 RepID=A0AAV5QJJ8_9ASCO|nr:mitochondrial 2-oxodicarboxylate carrier [Saccharomycopsis crataegensis]